MSNWYYKSVGPILAQQLKQLPHDGASVNQISLSFPAKHPVVRIQHCVKRTDSRQ